VSDVFLGVIAAAVLTMAVIQVAAIVFALRAARQVGDAVGRLERTMQPIVADLQRLSADAARATSVAAAQAERAAEMLTGFSRRLDETATAVQSSLFAPAREGYAMFQGLLAALAAFRHSAPSAAKRAATAEEEDALFIG
jgi:hypothetical protein